MKACDIQVGNVYIAKVSGKIASVRVLSINSSTGPLMPPTWKGRRSTTYTCLNIRTGRTIEVKSARRFRMRTYLTR